MQPGIWTDTSSLTGIGATKPVQILRARNTGALGASFGNGLFQPGILVMLSPAASLTYSIEVTGDDLDVAGYDPSAGNWAPFSGMGNLTASASGTLGAAVTAIRLHVTSYLSGTATFQFIQLM